VDKGNCEKKAAGHDSDSGGVGVMIKEEGAEQGESEGSGERDKGEGQI
jgi:hypothetical protein